VALDFAEPRLVLHATFFWRCVKVRLHSLNQMIDVLPENAEFGWWVHMIVAERALERPPLGGHLEPDHPPQVTAFSKGLCNRHVRWYGRAADLKSAGRIIVAVRRGAHASYS